MEEVYKFIVLKSSNIKIYSSNLINKTLKDEKNIIMASFKKFNKKRIQN